MELDDRYKYYGMLNTVFYNDESKGVWGLYKITDAGYLAKRTGSLTNLLECYTLDRKWGIHTTHRASKT